MNNECWVNVYSVDRLYGGPQEGGWWYNHYECVRSIPCHRDDAEEVRRRMSEEYGEGTEKYSLSSILSTGEVCVLIQDEAAQSQTHGKPCYE